MFFGMLSNNFGTYISQVHLIELKKKKEKKGNKWLEKQLRSWRLGCCRAIGIPLMHKEWCQEFNCSGDNHFLTLQEGRYLIINGTPIFYKFTMVHDSFCPFNSCPPLLFLTALVTFDQWPWWHCVFWLVRQFLSSV